MMEKINFIILIFAVTTFVSTHAITNIKRLRFSMLNTATILSENVLQIQTPENTKIFSPYSQANNYIKTTINKIQLNYDYIWDEFLFDMEILQ